MEDQHQKTSVSTLKKLQKLMDGRKTPRQKCNYCGSDIVDLIDRLKDHLI